jgi:hypothetical protein
VDTFYLIRNRFSGIFGFILTWIRSEAALLMREVEVFMPGFRIDPAGTERR